MDILSISKYLKWNLCMIVWFLSRVAPKGPQSISSSSNLILLHDWNAQNGSKWANKCGWTSPWKGCNNKDMPWHPVAKVVLTTSVSDGISVLGLHSCEGKIQFIAYLGVSKNSGTPKMDGLKGKTLLKWMIWGVLPPQVLETPISSALTPPNTHRS